MMEMMSVLKQRCQGCYVSKVLSSLWVSLFRQEWKTSLVALVVKLSVELLFYLLVVYNFSGLAYVYFLFFIMAHGYLHFIGYVVLLTLVLLLVEMVVANYN